MFEALGVCFEAKTTTEALRVIGKFSVSDGDCEESCAANTECAGYHVDDVECFLLASDSMSVACSAAFTYYARTEIDCARIALVSSYARDPCLADSVVLAPDVIIGDSELGRPGTCPNTSADGTDTRLSYLLSVMYVDGSYGIFDNDPPFKLTRNATSGKLLLSYTLGAIYRSYDITAAMCFYQEKDPDETGCLCGTLPLVSGTESYTNATAFEAYPSTMCQSDFIASRVFENIRDTAQLSATDANGYMYCRGGRFFPSIESISRQLYSGTCYTE